MILQVGSLRRPNNEAVVTPSYQPIYDLTRKVEAMRIRWDVSGRVVNFPVATQAITSREIEAFYSAVTSPNPRLQLLGDDGSPTPFVLDPSRLLNGPSLIDFSFPTSEAEVYVTGLSYRLTFEGTQYVGRGDSDLIEFSEEVSGDPGGVTYVYVGGAYNLPERQVATQNKSYKYVQSGSAMGLLAYPLIPPPIWPFALMSEPRVVRSSPQNLGMVDTNYRISWEYNYEWHTRLFGVPNRRS
jgi:hypothetical protein